MKFVGEFSKAVKTSAGSTGTWFHPGLKAPGTSRVPPEPFDPHIFHPSEPAEVKQMAVNQERPFFWFLRKRSWFFWLLRCYSWTNCFFRGTR